jgi:hypothetical protein
MKGVTNMPMSNLNCRTPKDLKKSVERISALGLMVCHAPNFEAHLFHSVIRHLGAMIWEYCVTAESTMENLSDSLSRANEFESLKLQFDIIKEDDELEPHQRVLGFEQGIREVDQFVEHLVMATSELRGKFKEAAEIELGKIAAMEAEKKRAAVDATTSSSELQKNR